MKAVIGLVLIALSRVSADVAGECNMAAFYLELGCEPEPPTEGLCPKKFNCPNLHSDPTKCYYKGKSFNDREAVPQGTIGNPCSLACSCSVYNNEPDFRCAAVDCFETFNNDMNQQCINTYELDSCCSSGKICGKDAIAKLKNCVIDGKTYLEGQQFEPANTGKTCICTPEWDGNIENRTYCREIECGIELHSQNYLHQNCAPVFFNALRSCPIGFECQTPSTKLIKGLNLKQLTGQCVFNNMTLTIGDEVTVEDKCTKCSCTVPPFVSCVKTYCDM